MPAASLHASEAACFSILVFPSSQAMFRNPAARCLKALPSTWCLQCPRKPLMGHTSVISTTAFISQHTVAKRTTRQRPATNARVQVRPLQRTEDPFRPVADMLLRSVMKRHGNLQMFGDTPIQMHNSLTLSSTVLKDMSTMDLIHAIKESPRGAVSKDETVDKIKRLLIKRLYATPLVMSLQACHSFYQQEQNMSQYLSALFSVIDEMFDDLSPSPAEITQLFLYIFIHGNAPQMLFYKVEEYLLTNLDRFHISDLGVICGGFFRANTRVSSQDLLDAVARKLLKEIEQLEPFLLPSFLKVFRHSSYIRVSFYNQLADHLVRSKLLSGFRSVNPLMHIAFTYASLSLQHELLFDQLLTLVGGLVGSEQRVRTKDISKFVWACGTLQFKPANYRERFQPLVRAFESSRGGRIYPESLGELLVGLVYLGIFPEDLLSKCLSYDVASQLMDSESDREKSMQLLLLHETVKIECPQYTGNLLSRFQVEKLLHHPLVAHDLDAQLKVRIGLAAVLSSLQEKLGADRVHCHYPLPHFNSAVIELQYCCERGFLCFTPKPVQSGADTLSTHTTITDHLISELAGQPSQAESQPPISSEVASELEWSSQEERCCNLSMLLSECLQTGIML
ncbi:hypothetical protein BaRGS_00009092 [Batillaria attramentaria]|uniref:FAST kinase leucine-rich domain-containing protein n=1 Tax=Batillaria attramentaria TaxID=370345 RepID=A0ABD0LJS1_9CAEN